MSWPGIFLVHVPDGVPPEAAVNETIAGWMPDPRNPAPHLMGILTNFGMSTSHAMAADLIWRAATYLPQVLIGIGTLLVWRRHQAKAAKGTG